MKNLLIPIFIALLTGCAVSPDSSKMLRDTTARIHEICHTQNTERTFRVLSRKMSTCYLGKDITIPIQAGSVFTVISSETRIDAIYRENGISEISVSMQGGLAPRVFGSRVEITQTDSCPAQVRVYILNMFWENRAEHVKKWLKGESVDCGYM